MTATGPDSEQGGGPATQESSSATGTAVDQAEKKARKKKDKARAAWISFAGRIVAQIVGAVAAVVLGLYIVGRSGGPANDAKLAAPIVTPAPTRVQRQSDGERSVAVLPLANLSGDPQQEYFADGMTEALIANLAQTKGLRVISRTSSMSYKGQQKSIPQIAQELGVGLIVEGSVGRSVDRIRVTAQLIDAARDEHIWVRTYDRTLRDVLALQTEVSSAIAAEVKGIAAQQRESSVRTVDPVAYDLYLRGRQAWNRRTPEGYAEAIRYFDQALERDPRLALAHAGRADAYQLGGQSLGEDAVVKARAAARRAIELDEALAEPHASLGGLLHRVDWAIDQAEREFRRAIELNPGYATAHQWYAILLAEEGRDEEAVRHGQEAVMLDPLSGPIRQTLGLVHYYGRRFDRAVAEERRALEFAPQLTLAREILGRSLVAQKSYADAVRLYEKQTATLSADGIATLSLAHQLLGDRVRADALSKQLLARRPVAVGPLVRWHAGTGDQAAALAALERAVMEGSNLRALKADPALDSLRGTPRFDDVMRRARAQMAPAVPER